MSDTYSIIILTYNEEHNLPALLDNLSSLDAPVFIVDSYSTDGTLAIIEENEIEFKQNPFENYAKQRNWAQDANPYPTDWVLHLDAGERLTPELLEWLKTKFDPTGESNGFLFSRRTYFMNKWIRYGGHYPSYHLRLFRRSEGRCESKQYDQHFVVNGPVEKAGRRVDIIDHVSESIKDLTERHLHWAIFEAGEQISHKNNPGDVAERYFGNPIERRRWLKNRLFGRVPMFGRSMLYFIYRYFFRLGFLDGKRGLIFHFLQGLWFRFLIDALVYEERLAEKAAKG